MLQWNTDAHMHMILHQMPFHDLAFLLDCQFMKHLSKMFADCTEYHFLAPFRNKRHVVFAIPFGRLANVEIKHDDLDESMIRAIARQAEAERERRAKVIHAEGELQASEKLMQAAHVLAQQQGAMQLRYMQTLSTIAGDKTSTIVFPLPVDTLAGLGEMMRRE